LKKKVFFNFLFQYFILKIFGLDFLNRFFPQYSWGPKIFSKMRSAYSYPEFDIKESSLQNRKLYIWGAGADGSRVQLQCARNNWKIEAFLDSNSQITEFHGYRVLHPQSLLTSESKDFFIVISSRKYVSEIAKICEQARLKEGLDFWRPNVK